MTITNQDGQSGFTKIWVSKNGFVNEKPAQEDCIPTEQAEMIANEIMKALAPICGFVF